MKTKICSKCRANKELSPISEFNWKNKSKGTYQPYCRECNATNSRLYYQNNKQKHITTTSARRSRVYKENVSKVIDYLSTHPCVDCQEDNIIVLDFDHENPDLKRECVSTMLRMGCAWHSILMEIAKCSVRCSNCHRIKTAKQLKSPKFLWWEHRDSNPNRPI